MLDGRWYVGGAGFVKGGDEGVVGGYEAVVGGVTTSAVIELDDVPAVAADRLRDVEIFFIAGEAVKKEDDGVWAGAFGDVGEGVEHGSVAGDLKALRGGKY